jgi:hypothetical protein
MSGVASALDGDQEVLGRDPDGAAGATIEAPDEVHKPLDELRPAVLRLEHGTSGDERPEVCRVIVDRSLLAFELEIERLAGDVRRRTSGGEDVFDVAFDAPQRRGLHALRRGGRKDPFSLKSPAAKPSFAQVVIATRPPLRQTRTNSAAARA